MNTWEQALRDERSFNYGQMAERFQYEADDLNEVKTNKPSDEQIRAWEKDPKL